MSLLKQKLAKKLTLLLGYPVNASDVNFHKNSRRRDVVRWSIFGYECFWPATFSVRKDVTLIISDETQSYGAFEIHAEQQTTDDMLVKKTKTHPFDTSTR
jgi:hypothetical protein